MAKKKIKRNNKYFIGGLVDKFGDWNKSATDDFMGSSLGKGLGKLGVSSSNLGGVANTAATAIGGVLAGGNESGVGNALQGIGSLASNIPGVGGLIGAGVNLLGGITNAAFGSKLNKEEIAKVEGQIDNLNSFTSNASDYDALASNYTNMPSIGYFSKDDIGSDGWFSDKAEDKWEELKKEKEQAEQWVQNSLFNNAQNIATNKQQLLEANYTAYGGPINMKYTGTMSPFGNQFDEGGHKESGIPTQEEYIAEQIAAKKAAALDKSRNRTSVRVPMIPNSQSEEEWNKNINALIESSEIALSNAMANKNYKLAKSKQEVLERYLEEKDKGYPKLVAGDNCMYNAGDCYGLNIPGNQTFTAKHKEKGFKRVDSSNMEPGDIVQDNRTGTPIHAMIYDSKDAEGNLRFNYARGTSTENINADYVRQGKYPLPLDDYATYRYVGTPADSTQWINEYKEMYNKKAKGGPLKNSEYYSIMEKVAKENYKNWGFDNEDEALVHALNDNTYNYREYYSKYPKSKANADTHWTDEFKTVYHPTFSNESVYSGKKSKFNPEGLIGGSWDGETFIPADWQNKKADGGNLFTNGVTIIGNGGTHEENPLEGVQMGIDPQGIPNLVEEGEVIFGDYVFSNRLRVPKAVRQKYKLRGTTFADAAKDVQKESEERPNDPISKKGLEASMQILMNEQEMVRAKKESNKYAKGGRLCNKFDDAGPIDKIDFPYSVYSSRPEDSFDFSKWFTVDKNNLGKVTDYTDAYRNYKFTADKAREWAKLFGNDESLKSYLSKGNKLEDLTDEDVQKGSLDNKHGWLHKARAMMANLDNANTIDVDNIFKELNKTPFKPLPIKSVPIEIEDGIEGLPEEKVKEIAPMKDNWLRKLPVWMSGVAVANDLFGGNEPDYSNADLFARAIRGTNRQIGYRPIGNYLKYTPFDTNYYINKLDADTAAGRRAVMNTSGGNRAAALAGILATDYNYGNQLGDLARKAEEYNLDQRQKVEDFNRNTNIFNSEAGTKVDMFNAEQDMQRARMYGSLAEYRDKVLAANRAEKSANLTNFIQGLGDLGRERADRDMLRWLTEKGVLKSADGGKINRRKKRGGFTI